MATATTDIAWTDRTWNPVRGCSIVSAGCHSCYAMKQAHRFSGPGQPYEGLTKLSARSGPQWTGQIRLVEDALLEPLKWRKPARVFVNSMSDLFHEGVPDEFISDVFGVMAMASRHTFQILTKRPERMRTWVDGHTTSDGKLISYIRPKNRDWKAVGSWPMPLPNVWLGVSVENQETADARIPLLLQTPAAVRFVSVEPLLGPVELSSWLWMKTFLAADGSGRVPTNELDWVIVGGESGPGARPICLSWVRGIVYDCADADVACFVKQLGAKPYEQYDDGAVLSDVRLRDRKGGDPAEWESYLRVREFPGGA